MNDNQYHQSLIKYRLLIINLILKETNDNNKVCKMIFMQKIINYISF